MTDSPLQQPLSEVTKVRKVDLARILQVTEQSVSNYVKEGMPVEGKGHNARYPLADCVKWVQQYEIRKALQSKNTPDDEDDAAIERRAKLAKAIREEYKTAEIMHVTVRVEDSEALIGAELERIRAKLLAIPGVWAPQMVGLKDIPDAMERLSDLVYLMMDELSTLDEEDDELEPESPKDDSDEPVSEVDEAE